jgi:hypothetical protein
VGGKGIWAVLVGDLFHPIYQYERFRNRALRLINRLSD